MMKKGFSGSVVNQNVQERVKGGMKPKQAIASSLAKARKYQKMAKGGMVISEGEDEGDEFGDMAVKAAGLPLHESMSEMGDLGPDDEERSLGAIQAEGRSHPDEVANPEEMNEAQRFAQSLRRKAMMAQMSAENYAMGGLVQPASDPVMGNEPEEDMEDGSEEPMSAEPMKPSSIGHANLEPQGMGLSAEAMEAIKRKRMGRKFGSYSPQ